MNPNPENKEINEDTNPENEDIDENTNSTMDQWRTRRRWWAKMIDVRMHATKETQHSISTW